MTVTAAASLWAVHPVEAAMPLAAVFVWLAVSRLWSGPARANRAKLRRARRAERLLVQRMRAW